MNLPFCFARRLPCISAEKQNKCGKPTATSVVCQKSGRVPRPKSKTEVRAVRSNSLGQFAANRTATRRRRRNRKKKQGAWSCVPGVQQSERRCEGMPRAAEDSN